MDDQERGFLRDPSEQAPKADPAAESEGFYGTFNHGLDSKNRVIIPAKLRTDLGHCFVICPTFDFSAVAVYPYDRWKAYKDNMKKLSRFNSKLQKYLENFCAMSYQNQDFDFQGRVVIPTPLINRLLKKSPEDDISALELQGCGDYIRIIAKAHEEESFADFLSSMDDIMEEINTLGRAQEQGKRDASN